MDALERLDRLHRARPVRALARLRRRVLLRRRPLAALLAAGAVLVGTQVVSPPPPSTDAVWTAARDLPGGVLLRAEDLVRTELPPAAVPRGTVHDETAALGRRLAAPMTRGEVLTGIRTLTPGILAGYPGSTAVPVRVGDADVVDLLRVGDRVTLVAGDPDGRGAPTTLAEDVPVIALPVARSGGPGSTSSGRIAVLAVPSATAGVVAVRASAGFLSVTWTD